MGPGPGSKVQAPIGSRCSRLGANPRPYTNQPPSSFPIGGAKAGCVAHSRTRSRDVRFADKYSRFGSRTQTVGPGRTDRCCEYGCRGASNCGPRGAECPASYCCFRLLGTIPRSIESFDFRRARDTVRRSYPKCSTRSSLGSSVRRKSWPRPGSRAQRDPGYALLSGESLPNVQTPEAQEILRNWLACGAPIVEATTAAPMACLADVDCPVTGICDSATSTCVEVGDVVPVHD